MVPISTSQSAPLMCFSSPMRLTAAIQSRRSRDLVSRSVRALLISFGTVVMESSLLRPLLGAARYRACASRGLALRAEISVAVRAEYYYKFVGPSNDQIVRPLSQCFNASESVEYQRKSSNRFRKLSFQARLVRATGCRRSENWPSSSD